MKDIDNDKPAFFVSRRGRQVGVHQVDLTGIDIESSDEPTTTTVKPTKAHKASRSTVVNTPRQRSGWTKRKIVILVIILSILSLPLLGAEFVTAQYRSGVTNAKHDLADLVRKTVLPAQEKSSISADQIRGIANDVNQIVGHMCRGGLLDNAASLYPRAKTALEDCKAAQSTYSSLTNSLYGLVGQARYLERVDAIIKPVATPITDEYAVIGAQQTAWQSAAEELKKVSPPDSMRSTHTELLVHVNGVTEAWSKLNTANNAQSAVDFEAAEKSLTIEYEAVRATSPAFSEVLAGTQASILKNYTALK